MVYKQKVLGLLEALQGKIRIIENISTGALRMENDQVVELIKQTKKLTEQISDLISIERD
jgi:hypothetical protein